MLPGQLCMSSMQCQQCQQNTVNYEVSCQQRKYFILIVIIEKYIPTFMLQEKVILENNVRYILLHPRKTNNKVLHCRPGGPPRPTFNFYIQAHLFNCSIFLSGYSFVC